jgi:hypothetical protein
VCLCFSSKEERQVAKLKAGSTGIENQNPLKVHKLTLTEKDSRKLEKKI